MERTRRSTRRKAREDEGTARPVSRTTTRRVRTKPVVVQKEDTEEADVIENLQGSASNKAPVRSGRARAGRRTKKAAPSQEEEDEEDEAVATSSSQEPSQEAEAEEAESQEDTHEESEANDEEEEDEDVEMEEAPVKASKGKQPAAEVSDAEEEAAEEAEPTPAVRPQESIPSGPSLDFDTTDRVATSAHGERGAVPRLMIQSIELTNFKSYAGKKTIGPFHQRFSAVVGPNGSGKSNLIDALLFVFGYRTKKLRLNKVSELIHNSNHGRGLQSAKVEVFFQQVLDREGPGEEYDILPDSKFSVSRVATSDNKSSYYINDKKKTFSDVQKELTKHHIDLNNNRFLILQGEVELISQMKPKGLTPHEDGLLEYIEDIIGTNLLIPAIDEAAEKVHEANAARAVQINRVRAADKAMNALEGAKEEAEEHRSLQVQIIDNSATLYQLQAVSHQAQAEQLEADREEIATTLAEVHAHQDKYNGQLEELDKEFSSKTKEHATVHKEMLACKEKHDDFEKQRAKLKQGVKNHKSKCKTLAKTQEKEAKKMKELQRSLDTARSDLASAEESVTTLQEELKKEEAELVKIQGSLKGKTASLRQDMEAAKKELMPKQKKITEIQASIDIAESELSMLQAQANEAQQKLDETTAAIAEAKEQAAEATKKMKEKKTEVARATERIPFIEEERTRAEAQEEDLARNKADIEAKLDENDAQANASRSQSKVLQACMMLKVERNLGVHGRLGDLGSIDDRYDVAVTTACGSQLDQIVVDTTSDAQQCANFLRERQVGRCTFLILERIQNLRSRMHNAKGRTPAQRLFDLITPKSDLFLPAFYSVVRDTLLADDFPTAKKIAFGKSRFRVVTMDGQVIEQSGLLSGGGSRKMKGGMRGSGSSGPSLSKAAVQKLRAQLAGLQKELDDVRQVLASLEEEKTECEETVENAHLELTTLDMDAKAMARQEKELSAQLPELKKKAAVKTSAADLKRIKALEAEISKSSKPLAQAKAGAADLEETIKTLQEKIMDVGGMPLKIQQAKVDGIESQLGDTHRVITRIQVQLKTVEKNVAKCTKAIAAAETGLEEETQQVEQKKQQLEELVSSAKEVKQKYEEAQEVLDKTSEELALYTKQVDKAKSKLSKLRAAKTDLEMQLSDLDDKMKSSDASKKGCFERLKVLEEEKASLYDEYELETVDVSIKHLQAEDIRGINAKQIHQKVADLKEQMEAMSPNMGAIAEYRAQEREFHKRAAELQEKTQHRDDLQKRCEELRKQRLDGFMTGFAIINTKLKEMYRLITLEGDAELEFVDTIDPFSEGIVFSVRPPKKSWKNIANLSGGEKTLSSLALVFALHHYKPTPLYFMDEIDAALDFKNVSIVAHYIKERTKNAQFIIISLRNNMFELADRLVGIYKPENCTYSVAITPKNFSIGADQQQQQQEQQQQGAAE